MNYSVILPAAGKGLRLGLAVPKAFAVLESAAGSSLLSIAARLFDGDPNCVFIVVCVDGEWRDAALSDLAWSKKCQVVVGSETRQGSVANGVKALGTLLDNVAKSVVLVHDAARCCLSRSLIERVAAGVLQHGAVTCAVPASDALVRCKSGMVVNHFDREGVWSVQTPQGFYLTDLLEAHARASDGTVALDDATLVQRLRPVHVVEGDRLNLKVTMPSDLILVERLFEKGLCNGA